MGMGVYGGKDFRKRYVFSLEWKSEGVMDVINVFNVPSAQTEMS